MSSEPDYNFNQPAASTTPENTSLHLPFALLSAAIAIILVQQTINSFKLKSSLNEGKDQLAKASTNAGPAMQQATDYEKKFSSLAQDLILLSKTDDTAKAIVSKYGIGIQPNPNAPAAPEPAK